MRIDCRVKHGNDKKKHAMTKKSTAMTKKKKAQEWQRQKKRGNGRKTSAGMTVLLALE